MSWYRTYRPQTVAGLHSEAIRSAMEKIRQSGQFSHAYIMLGPRGTGKTTSARILARMLNCEKNLELVKKRLQNEKVSGAFAEPCGACGACQAISDGTSMCVIEIDAASHTGVDNVRSLQEMLALTAPDGPVRVCIFDEVHMLSKGAFNALLKVLEEPPRHVVFVLATTNPEKVPPTVLSRCQMLQSRMATVPELAAALRGVAAAEEIAVEQPVLEELARAADGSFRDAVKLFEQACWGRKSLSMEELEAGSLGQVKTWTQQLLQALEEKNAGQTGEIFQTVQESGADTAELQKSVLYELHERVLADKDLRALSLLKFLNQPLNPNLSFPSLPFEIACLEWCVGAAAPPSAAAAAPQSPKPMPRPASAPAVASPAAPAPQMIAPSAVSKPQISNEETVTAPDIPERKVYTKAVEISPDPVEPEPMQESVSTEENTGAVSPVNFLDAQEKWGAILASVRKKNASMSGILKTAQPISSDQQLLTIEVAFPFHKDKLEEEKHLRLLEASMCEVCGWPKVRLSFVVGKTPVRKFGVTAQSGTGSSAGSGDGTPSSEEDTLADAVASALM